MRLREQALAHYNGLQQQMSQWKDKFPSIDFDFHAAKLISLLGDMQGGFDEKDPSQRSLTSSLSGEVSEQVKDGEFDDDDNFQSPERDVRALQYDACSEYFMYGKFIDNISISNCRLLII